jgi:hypothetical protein
MEALEGRIAELEADFPFRFQSASCSLPSAHDIFSTGSSAPDLVHAGIKEARRFSKELQAGDAPLAEWFDRTVAAILYGSGRNRPTRIGYIERLGGIRQIEPATAFRATFASRSEYRTQYAAVAHITMG